jgi:hypothetical protein
MDDKLTDWQENNYLPFITSEMRKEGYPMFPYISFREWHNPRSGMVAWAADPRLSQGYTAIRNRPGLLVETHMLKDYKTRVSGTYELLHLTLKHLNKNGDKLQQLIKEADDYTASKAFRNNDFPVEFKPSSDSTMVDFEGIEYDIVKSELTGAEWFKYGNEPKTFHLPYFNDLQPATRVKLPEFYVIPAQWNEVIERIKMHGIKYTLLEKEMELQVNTYRFSDVSWSRSPYEGRQRIRNFQIHPVEKLEQYPEGSVVIDMAQPHARVIAHILEPAAPDSYVKWGFFNAVFEQKEYAEMYVMEKKARQMLEKDPALRKEFEEKMKNDPNFAKSPWAISNWFYRKTPYWDERLNLYPVGKINDRKYLEEKLKLN